jgi:hypothetical protein
MIDIVISMYQYGISSISYGINQCINIIILFIWPVSIVTSIISIIYNIMPIVLLILILSISIKCK